MSAEILPNEILRSIFRYLSPEDLSRTALVCKKWFNTPVESLWKFWCQYRWKSKKNMKLELFQHANYSLVIKELSVKELKSILTRRNVKYQHLIEKSEFADLVLKTTTKLAVPAHGKWKSSYINAELDSKRTAISKYELCSKKWNFRFKEWTREQPGMMARFNEDYTYTSDLMNANMRWRFYAGDVQVEQYPPLSPSRTADWGWKLENEYVEFYEVPT